MLSLRLKRRPIEEAHAITLALVYFSCLLLHIVIIIPIIIVVSHHIGEIDSLGASCHTCFTSDWLCIRIRSKKRVSRWLVQISDSTTVPCTTEKVLPCLNLRANSCWLV